MSLHALAFHPAHPDLVPAARFVDELQSCGFLSEAFDFYGTRRFRPGERFFDFTQFQSGHSVTRLTQTADGFAESEPRDSREFCQIELITDPSPSLVCGCNVREPRCPACGSTFTNWASLIDQWHKAKALWSCPSCRTTYSPHEVDWQNTAGYARYWIEVREIHEGEAKPSLEFFQLLAEKTGCEWRYFWFRL